MASRLFASVRLTVYCKSAPMQPFKFQAFVVKPCVAGKKRTLELTPIAHESFCAITSIYPEVRLCSMKPEQIKNTAKALNELSESYADLFDAIKNTAKTAEATKNLWREGKKSRLIKIGLSLVVFPEPTPISETVGACFIAAGAIQKGIQSRSIFLEDVTKTFKKTFQDVLVTSQSLRI